MSVPVWERIRAADRRPLTIGPMQRVEVELLRVVDGDLPDLEEATVFDAWRDSSGYSVRAVRLTDTRADPYLVHAVHLEIGASDGRLEALLGEGSVVGAPGELERLACACRGISADTVYRAIAAGWSTMEQLKRSSRIAFGECQGRRCVPWLAERLELAADDPRAQVRPRPPLVPVPVSVLAAFAKD